MEKLYDVIVIGGGPAGLTAALYLARACYRVLVIEKEKFGGQITITEEIVNFPGVKKSSGTHLTETMKQQAEAFGAEFLLAEAEALELDGEIKRVYTNRGVLECFGILLATGAHPRQVGFQGEEEFKGHGVAYCATCDGEFFRGKEIFVIGGGFAAAEESVFLTKYASHVTLLIREPDFTCAKSVADKTRNHEGITVLTNVTVEEVSGDTVLRKIRYRDTLTDTVKEYTAQGGDTFGVFVFAGYEPASELVSGQVELNNQGYILTDQNKKTNLEGVYAAGDVCVKSLRQVVTAVGDGALAATELEHYASMMQEKTGRYPERPNRSNSTDGEEDNPEEKSDTADTDLFTGQMRRQLQEIFDRMEKKLQLKLYLDDRPVSEELKQYMEELAAQTDKLQINLMADGEGMDILRPCVKVCFEDGTETGLAFHGVPGGHEFTSFVLGLYNAAGPGQQLEDDSLEQISVIREPVDMQIFVSLSCTMCPELVTSAQRIAAANSFVTAEVFDLNHFPELKEQYQVMSVPCLVIPGREPVFGKKNIHQLLELLIK